MVSQQEVQINDNLHCSPIFEIRDQQAAAKSPPNSNQAKPVNYGNAGIGTHVEANMSYQPVDTRGNGGFGTNYFNPDSPSYSIPTRQRSTQYSMNRVASLGDSLSPPGSENAPSPINNNNNDRGSTRSGSYKDSSSHSSFTPPSMTDTVSSSDRHNSLPTGTANSNPSPQTLSSGATPSGFAEATSNFFNGNPMDSNFSTFQPGFFSQPIDASGNFGMSGWEMSGIEITTGTGMTPIPTGMTPGATDWNAVLDNMESYGGTSTDFFGNTSEKRGGS